MPATHSRRTILYASSLLCLSGMSLLAGCANEPAGGNGRLEGRIVDTVPSDATVVTSNDERIVDERLVQSFIRKIIRNGDASQEFDEREVDDLSNTLSELPLFEPNRQTDAPMGYYIAKNQTTVALKLIIEQ